MNNEPKLIIDRPYKYDRAMIAAIKRIPANYPQPLSMVSKVKDFQNKESK